MNDNNWQPGQQILLVNGPWNDKLIEDLGTVKIRMSIAQAYEDDGSTPKVGVKIGSAIYEPTEDRTMAFWLCNEWEGTFVGRC